MIETAGREIVVERLLSALPADVFRAWTTPEESTRSRVVFNGAAALIAV